MKDLMKWIINWYSLGKNQGFWFSFKYKTGIAKEGKDFY